MSCSTTNVILSPSTGLEISFCTTSVSPPPLFFLTFSKKNERNEYNKPNSTTNSITKISSVKLTYRSFNYIIIINTIVRKRDYFASLNLNQRLLNLLLDLTVIKIEQNVQNSNSRDTARQTVRSPSNYDTSTNFYFNLQTVELWTIIPRKSVEFTRILDIISRIQTDGSNEELIWSFVKACRDLATSINIRTLNFVNYNIV